MAIRCAKCDGSMTQGVTIDYNRGISTWVDRAPVKSIWVGFKLLGKKRIQIETWRCNRCYYLESYAPNSTS